MSAERPVLNMKEQFGDRYRVRRDPRAALSYSKQDEPWLWVIDGPHGYISPWSVEKLAAVAIGKYHVRRLATLCGLDLSGSSGDQTLRPGWKVLQWGDWELRCGFPTEELDEVARVLGIKQRRRLSEQQRTQLTARLAAIKARRSAEKQA